MDNMENKGQGMVTSTAKGGFPPAPQYTQRQASGILGIQDQGMEERDIRTTKTRKSFECWLKSTSDVPTGVGTPELVALRECLEEHDDHIDFLYLTDSEVTLQAIHKWIGGGAKLNLSRSPDTDVLKTIILKLQKRVETGATTLLIKVKDHRGDPLNEETDIRADLGRLKEYKETIWNDPSDRTVYE